MNLAWLVDFVVTWGLIGSGVITLWLLGAWATGLLGEARANSTDVRERLGAPGIVGVVVSIILYLVLIGVADVAGIGTREGLSFGRLWAINYLVFFFWLIFDTLIVDIVLVTLWRPRFLKLPDPAAHGSVAYHLSTIPRGMVFGVLVSLVGTSVSWFVLL